jgi:hypothetical protein
VIITVDQRADSYRKDSNSNEKKARYLECYDTGKHDEGDDDVIDKCDRKVPGVVAIKNVIRRETWALDSQRLQVYGKYVSY